MKKMKKRPAVSVSMGYFPLAVLVIGTISIIALIVGYFLWKTANMKWYFLCSLAGLIITKKEEKSYRIFVLLLGPVGILVAVCDAFLEKKCNKIMK